MARRNTIFIAINHVLKIRFHLAELFSAKMPRLVLRRKLFFWKLAAQGCVDSHQLFDYK
jgi:hypothetical protein